MRKDLFRGSCHESEELSVFIKRDGNHTGLIHRDDDGLHLLDYAGPSEIRGFALRPVDDFPCIIPNAHPAAIQSVAGMCRLIAKRYGRGTPVADEIPYSFRWAGDTLFDTRTGAYQVGSTPGLSCATFVLAVFQSAGVPLADSSTWEFREEDRARFDVVLNAMQSRTSAEEWQALANEWPCCRVRPEEAAGAGMAERLPASYPEAAKAGQWILAELYGVDPDDEETVRVESGDINVSKNE